MDSIQIGRSEDQFKLMVVEIGRSVIRDKVSKNGFELEILREEN